MGSEKRYPKRLIEVDLPIKEISAHARREKSIRHGHISTLHIWWARRPLAACRAVICATLWPDPADEMCPPNFRESVTKILCDFAESARTQRELQELTQSHWGRWSRLGRSTWKPLDPVFWWDMRYALLDFIADFANWDASTQPMFLATARRLTQAAHEALGGTTGIRPLVVDPFAGGGSIPLESLRVGADAFASDLNPVPVLLNKVILEFVPQYGQRLADEVRRWGEWIRIEAEKELSEFYPRDPDGATPIAYLWARTIRCEGPDCGAEVPLLRSLWLSKRGKRSVALRITPNSDKRYIELTTVNNARAEDVGSGTCSGGKATCPICGFTTPVESVRVQLSSRKGGAHDARLIAVVTSRSEESGQSFRLPNPSDETAFKAARIELDRRAAQHSEGQPLIPNGKINHLRGFFNIVLYGITEWGDIFSPRQALTLSTFARLVRDLPLSRDSYGKDQKFYEAVKTCLGLVVDRVAVRCTSNCIWDATTGCIMQVFNQGQSLPARWEFAEMSPCIDSGSGWMTSIDYTIKVIEHVAKITHTGHAEQSPATMHPLPSDSAQAIITDPPYYAAIPYADLSDFFYSWLKRSLEGLHTDLLNPPLTGKDLELVSLAHRAAMYREKDNDWFEQQMELACIEARRVCEPQGLGVFVFANKETKAWEAMLAALINAGWIVTASWPIDTESGNRLRAKESAALASSIHLVCRPREAADGTVPINDVGDWRDILQKLPSRIHEWMPRLANEGVVGADAIFACLGPALEIFSSYSRVEKTSGDLVTLKDYLIEVWAAVAREALSMIFEEADATGLEEDARLTAMWLWTLSTTRTAGESSPVEGEDSESFEEDTGAKGRPLAGFTLEYDAARKIAQGLGAHLEMLRSLVEVKGEKARLLPVAERTRYLFGKEAVEPAGQRRAKRNLQMGLFQELEAAEEQAEWRDTGAPTIGSTVLDRVHQAMILFAAGRSEALKRFLVEEGVGHDARFWKLAQSLSALYPTGTDEKRWVDGVLARKKGLGFG